MNQYFENDDYFFSVVDESDTVKKTLFSRVEDYSLYKGLNRTETKPEDYKYYAKFYIRADTKKTIMKRRYQKIMEFYADSSSLLIALLEALFIISSFIKFISFKKMDKKIEKLLYFICFPIFTK